MLVHTLLHFMRGFAMGSADIVPGVSGGTIALVLGIYERFIASVRAGSKALTLLVRARCRRLPPVDELRSSGPSSCPWWPASAWPS